MGNHLNCKTSHHILQMKHDLHWFSADIKGTGCKSRPKLTIGKFSILTRTPLVDKETLQYQLMLADLIQTYRIMLTYPGSQQIFSKDSNLLDCWIVELLNFWIVELLNCWIVDLLNCWMVKLLKCQILELFSCWIVEVLRRWIVQLFNCWSVVVLKCWNFELLNCWMVELLKMEFLNCWTVQLLNV